MKTVLLGFLQKKQPIFNTKYHNVTTITRNSTLKSKNGHLKIVVYSALFHNKPSHTLSQPHLPLICNENTCKVSTSNLCRVGKPFGFINNIVYLDIDISVRFLHQLSSSLIFRLPVGETSTFISKDFFTLKH